MTKKRQPGEPLSAADMHRKPRRRIVKEVPRSGYPPSPVRSGVFDCLFQDGWTPPCNPDQGGW